MKGEFFEKDSPNLPLFSVKDLYRLDILNGVRKYGTVRDPLCRVFRMKKVETLYGRTNVAGV